MGSGHASDASLVNEHMDHRLTISELEIGVEEGIKKYFEKHGMQPKGKFPKKRRLPSFRARGPQWLREMLAEAIGVFLFVYAGIASIAWLDSAPADSHTPADLIPVALCFSLGIAFAVTTVAPISGGHLSPAFTLAFAYWSGFPWRKVPLYITAQLFGGFLAALLVLGGYWERISLLQFDGQHVASLLVPFPAPEQGLARLFLIEFFADFFISLIVWACLAKGNPFVSKTTAPFIIGFAFTPMILAYGGMTIATNTARDFGPRMVAAMFWGSEAFTFRGYPWIPVLVNIPATFFASFVYEVCLKGSMGQKVEEVVEEEMVSMEEEEEHRVMRRANDSSVTKVDY